MSQLETIAEHLEKVQEEKYLQSQEGLLKESPLEGTTAKEDALEQGGELEAPREGELLAPRAVNEEWEARRGEAAVDPLEGEEVCASPVEPTDQEEGATSTPSEEEEGGEEEDTFGMVAAANRLRVAPSWLKSVVPCTFYTYEEVDGRKKIKEYFWSRELIRLLHQLRSKKASSEEVQFIAEHCCEGDVTWSREIIGRLKSYSRTEVQQKAQPSPQPPKGQQPPKSPQPQKAQQPQKSPQGQKGAQPKPQQQKAQQGRPAQHPAKPNPRPRPEGERVRKPSRSQ